MGIRTKDINQRQQFMKKVSGKGFEAFKET